jgi:hypothetical protein
MSLEPRDLIVDLASTALALAEAAISGLWALYAAGASNGLDPGALAGGAAGAAAGGAAASGGPGGDRGFRYSGRDGTVRDSPADDGTIVDSYPAGVRLRYDAVVRDARGNPTHYHVTTSGRPSGYIPAGSTTANPPIPPPRPSIILKIDSGLGGDSSRAAHANAGRG